MHCLPPNHLGITIAPAALYFAFLEFLAKGMALLGPVGLLPMLAWVYYGTMDNPFTSVYSLCTPVWMFYFAKAWRRRNRELTYQWHTDQAGKKQGERFQFRHDDAVTANTERGDFYSDDDLFVPVGQRVGDGNSYDREKRVARVVMSWLVVVAFMMLSFLVMVLILTLRAELMAIFDELPEHAWWLPHSIYETRVYAGSGIAVIFSALWTFVSNLIGRKLAKLLTDWENHRIAQDHDTALLLKKFAIIFVNSYSGLIYIAFFKATPAGALLGFLFHWLDDVSMSLGFLNQQEHDLLARDYCHDMSNVRIRPACFRPTSVCSP